LLMKIFSDYLDNEIDELKDNDIRVRFSGKTRNWLPACRKRLTARSG
jgi:undecaprenyl pyrophosphate synthase